MDALLVVNAGSSSLKFQLFTVEGGAPVRCYRGQIDGIGVRPRLKVQDADGASVEDLRDRIAVLEALSDVLGQRGMLIRIGHENRRDELSNISLVATNFGTSSADGVVGVIGPTRMDYNRAISAVRSVADGLEDVLA